MGCFFTSAAAKAGSIRRIYRSIRIAMRSSVFLLFAMTFFKNAHGQDRLVDHFPDAADSGCIVCHNGDPNKKPTKPKLTAVNSLPIRAVRGSTKKRAGSVMKIRCESSGTA